MNESYKDIGSEEKTFKQLVRFPLLDVAREG